MEVTVKLNNSGDETSSITLDLTEADPLISEIISELRKQLSDWYVAVMERGIVGLDGPEGIDSVPGGLETLPKKASLFLAVQNENGIRRLEDFRHASDYQIDKDTVLILMCSPISLDD